ncbi:MAG: hypothetical protein D6780_07645 [Candidatus Dadabacteria bacterium]|nr:MAG: hypothetical protein D6780_07645 [Candidatus Dadabacteria bacterium]
MAKTYKPSGLHTINRAGYRRYLPVPRSANGSFVSVLGSALRTVTGVGLSSGLQVGIDPQYAALIEKQMQVQTTMQTVSMTSNISRSEHETRMSAIRNIRAQ